MGRTTAWERDVLDRLERIAAALEAANRADPLAMIAEALGEGETPQTGAEGAREGLPPNLTAPLKGNIAVAPEGPTEQYPGVLAIYRHPAGDGWRILARRQAGVPGGWAVSVEGVG
jgi:hypothetical protein